MIGKLQARSGSFPEKISPGGTPKPAAGVKGKMFHLSEEIIVV
jgi:hypothetical protein